MGLEEWLRGGRLFCLFLLLKKLIRDNNVQFTDERMVGLEKDVKEESPAT